MKTIDQIVQENMEHNQQERIREILNQIEQQLEKISDEMESHETNITEFLHGTERLLNTARRIIRQDDLYILDTNTWIAHPYDLQRVLGDYQEIPVAEEFYGMEANKLYWRYDADVLQAAARQLCLQDKGHYEFVTLLNGNRTVWRKNYVPI